MYFLLFSFSATKDICKDMATGSSLSAADEALSTTEEKANFIRLTRLLMCGGLALLREVFDNIHPPANLPAVLGNPVIKKKLQTLRGKRVLFPPEWKCLYNSSGPGVHGKSTDFDISLLYKLLREICNFTAPATGWDIMPNSTDHSLQADIVRIRSYRNTIYSHHPRFELTDADFEKFWIEISETLLRIAGHLSRARRDEWKTSIEKLLHDPLDEKKCVEEFLLWCLKEQEKLSKKVEDQGEKIKQLQFEQQLMRKEKNLDLEKPKDKDKEIKNQVTITIFLESVNASGSFVSSCELPMPAQVEGAQSSSANVEARISIALEQPPAQGTTPLSTGTELQVSQQNRSLVLDFWSAVYSFGKSSVNLLIRYLKEKLGVEVQECSKGSLIITVSCCSLEVLEALWIEYCTGHLNKAVQDTLVTAEVLEKLDLREAKLRTVISEEDYLSHKEFLKNSSGNDNKSLNGFYKPMDRNNLRIHSKYLTFIFFLLQSCGLFFETSWRLLYSEEAGNIPTY